MQDAAVETPTSSISLEEGFEQFIYACRVEGKAEKTVEQYKYVIENFLSFLGRDPALDKIGPNTVRGFISRMMEGDYSKSTIAIHHRVLRAFFNWLVNEGLLRESPVANIKEPKTPDKFPKALSREQAQKLLRTAKDLSRTWAGYRNYAIVTCFLDMGLRLSELINARLPDLNMKERTLKINGKGSKDRMVFFGLGTYKCLNGWLEKREQKGKVEDREIIFISQNGDRLKKRHVQRTITNIQKRAGLEDVKVSPHVLRHTAATLAVDNGMRAFALKSFFGWETIRTAMKYVHMSSRSVREEYKNASPIDSMKGSS